MKNKNVTIVSIILIVFALVLIVYLVFSARIDAMYTPNYNLDDFTPFPVKKAEVNEYSVVRVSEDDMVKTYFNNYTLMLFEDIEEAYEKVDHNAYKSLAVFRGKAGELTKDFTELPILDTYSYEVEEHKDGSKTDIYKVHTKNGHVITFKVEAVMKYRVLLD